MSVCALSEGECGNPYLIFLHIHISVVYNMYTSAHMSLCLQSLCTRHHSPTHLRWLKDRLEKQVICASSNHTFTYPCFSFSHLFTPFFLTPFSLLFTFLKLFFTLFHFHTFSHFFTLFSHFFTLFHTFVTLFSHFFTHCFTFLHTFCHTFSHLFSLYFTAFSHLHLFYTSFTPLHSLAPPSLSSLSFFFHDPLS